jgi:hypothetical protein
VSRETRLLLLTVVVSLVALSLLARLRFPEQPARVNPVPPLLTQLAAPRGFEDLAAEISRLEALVLPAIDIVTLESADGTALPRPRAIPGFRFRDDRVFAIASGAPIRPGVNALIGRDPGSGLVVLSRPPLPPAPFVPEWTAERTVQPRYMAAAVASPWGPSIRPVFVGALRSIDSVIWSASVWRLEAAPLEPGTLLFTTAGAFAGIVAEEGGASILVPASVVAAAAERLTQPRPWTPGTLGIEVQALPRSFAAATGAQGLVVSWVDPEGPAAELVVVTDIIEGVENAATLTLETWQVRGARLAAGDEVNLRIKRDGVVHAVTVVAAEMPKALPDIAALGATFRARARAGAEVIAVERGSVADRAGLRPGDLVTRVGGAVAPAPAVVTNAFSALESGAVLLAAVTRGDDHLVLELVKP